MVDLIALTGNARQPHARWVPLDPIAEQALDFVFQQQYKRLDPDKCDVHPYAAGFRPPPGEIVGVRFSLPDLLMAFKEEVPPRTPQLTTNHIEQAEPIALVGIMRDPLRLLFQAVDQRSFLMSKTVRLFSARSNFVLDKRVGLTLGNKLHAVHDGKKLYFESEFMVRRFLDLDPIFRPASDSKIRAVLGSDVFTGFDWKAVEPHADEWVRRKVSAIEGSRILESIDQRRLRQTGEAVDVPVTFRGNRIVIPTDKRELKGILRLLDEDYLQSMITTNLYLSTSKRKVTKKAAAKKKAAKNRR